MGRRQGLGVLALLTVPAILAAVEPTPAPQADRVVLAAVESVTTPTAPTRPRPPEPPVRRATLALTGDILIHNTVWEAARTAQGFDFGRMLAPVRAWVADADLALCHLETPVSPPGGPFESYPLFAAPPAVLDGLVATGYDGCTTASNHTVDQGFSGVRETLAALDRRGLGHTGSARSPRERRRITTYDVGGMRIASLAYTFGTNGMPVDADKPWSVNLIDAAVIEQDARRARRSGADAVLVALHWGDEYRTEPNEQQVALADRLTRSRDITLIYGHHAHVVQPIRKVNGRWVVFGLGNFLAGQRGYMPGVDDGVVARVTLVQRGDGPVRVLRPRYRHTRIGADFVVRPAS